MLWIVAFHRQTGISGGFISACLVFGLIVILRRLLMYGRCYRGSGRINFPQLEREVMDGHGAWRREPGPRDDTGGFVGVMRGVMSFRKDPGMALEEGLLAHVQLLQRRRLTLETLANLAVLAGLLGTVLGMFVPFCVGVSESLAEYQRFQARWVSSALWTSCYGLSVAIFLRTADIALATIAEHLMADLRLHVRRLAAMLDTSPAVGWWP